MIIREKNNAIMDIDSDDNEFNFLLKFDGCCEITRYFNHSRGSNNEDFDRIHICELEELRDMIDKIIKLHKQIKD